MSVECNNFITLIIFIHGPLCKLKQSRARSQNIRQQQLARLVAIDLNSDWDSRWADFIDCSQIHWTISNSIKYKWSD